MTSRAPSGYVVDPLDPRAPSGDEWARMTPDERERVVAALPTALPEELAPPEGDFHRKAKETAVDALDSFFRRMGRKVYVTAEIGVYYPGEPRFAPDVLAVLDVEPHERNSWMVSKEGKGLDFVLEVHVAGDFSKDHVHNVERYATLGIAEYFLFDRTHRSLYGYRLAAPGRRVYERIVPQLGRYASHVLGLDLGLEGERLRFFIGGAGLPDSAELVAQLGKMVTEVIQHKEDLERALEEERRALEAERRALEAERRALEAERRALEEERRAREAAERARDDEARARQTTELALAEALAEIARLRDKQG